MGTGAIALFLIPISSTTASSESVFSSASKQSQEEYSDQELKALVRDFVDIIPQLQAIVIESNQEIATIIKAEGLEERRFYEILRSSDPQAEATAAEQQKFESIKNEIVPIQQEALFAMYQVINEEKGMTMQELEAIVDRVHNDVALQEELQKIIIDVLVEQGQSSQ
jgi:hypothetical protein